MTFTHFSGGLLGFVLIAVFGPYIPFPLAGVRTEQLGVYIAFLITGLLALSKAKFPGRTLVTIGVWLMYLLIAALGVLWPSVVAEYEPGNALSGLDRLLRPLGLLLIARAIVATDDDASRLLRLACRIVVAAMCLNALLALATIFVDTAPLLSLFWTPSTSPVVVAILAAQLGRYSGMFNQPAEAGALYSIAALAAIYLWPNRPWRLAASFALLTIGGVLSVSKLFLLVGLPLAVWQLARIPGDRARRLLAVGCVAGLGLAVIQFGLLPDWIGARFFESLFQPDRGLLEYYTAYRLGGSSSLLPVVSIVRDNSPLIGFGAAGLNTPYDNGWVEAFVLAGLVGVTAYTITLGTLLFGWWSLRRTSPKDAALGGALGALTIAGSVGLPMLTANRVATVLWLLLSLTVLRRPAPASGQGIRDARSPVAGQ